MSGARPELAPSPDARVLFPDCGATHGDVVYYYRRIADVLVPHLRDRALAWESFPDGIAGEATRGEGTCGDVVSCVGLAATSGALTLYASPCRDDKPENPDRVVFDLEPPDDRFDAVRGAAVALKELLEELNLVAWVMVSGARALQVVAPLDRQSSAEDVFAFAKGVAAVLCTRADGLTLDPKDREGKVLVDCAGNAPGARVLVPYSVRARAGAPVATPITWDELGKKTMSARKFSMDDILDRLEKHEDPWKNLTRHGRSLKEPTKRLRAMMGA